MCYTGRIEQLVQHKRPIRIARLHVPRGGIPFVVVNRQHSIGAERLFVGQQTRDKLGSEAVELVGAPVGGVVVLGGSLVEG